MPLPTTIKKPPTNLESYTIFLAGTKKVGKTSFCTQFPGHFVMEFEVGNASHLEANWQDVPTLKVFKETLVELEKNPTYCKVLILDEINVLYTMIMNKLCKEEAVLDPQSLGFGRGWGAIGREWDDYIRRIQALPVLKIYTGHSELKEVKTRDDRKVTRLTGALGGRVSKSMDALSHIYGVMDFNKDGSRYIQVVGDDLVTAGHGFQGTHFKNIENGRIELGSTPEEGYKKFIAAWNNDGVSPVTKTTPIKKRRRPVSNG